MKPQQPVRLKDPIKPSFKDIAFSFFVVIIFTSSLLASFYTPEWLFITTTSGYFLFGPGMLKIIYNDLWKFPQNLRDYKLTIEENERAYQRLISLYQEKWIPEYEAATIEWYAEKSRPISTELILAYRKSQLANLLQKTPTPVYHPSHNDIKKGATENNVLSELVQYFPDKVYINATLCTRDKVSDFDYLPDFIIHDTKSNYSAIVEIDEPYEFNFGDPIHCLGDDQDRNDFFNSHNWIVIRFTEQQFLQQPKECCAYIGHVINKATMHLSNFKEDDAYTKLINTQCWNKDEAIAMEIANFRESYLPNIYNGHSFLPGISPTGNAHKRRYRRELRAAELRK